MTLTQKKKDTESITLSQIPPFLKEHLASELTSFIARNALAHDKKPTNKVICLHCLKAYTLSLANKSENKRITERIHEVLPGPVGHQGYYLDQEKICPID